VKRTLSHDAILRRLEVKRRAEAGQPPATDADEPLGLLLPTVRRDRYEAALTERRAEIAAAAPYGNVSVHRYPAHAAEIAASAS
jgi:hypothetical protein